MPAELDALVVDEVLAHRLTHCLANGIGTEDQRARMLTLLKRYPDYRRVLASYLFGIKRNPVLQKMLAEDDRPHVGLVVLLQNIPMKPVKERHEVLKAAYRVDEETVRQILRDPDLDIAALYAAIPTRSKPPTRLVTAQGDSSTTRQTVTIQHESGHTYVSGNTYPIKEMIKQAARRMGGAARWDRDGNRWVIESKQITEKDIFG
jgi:hypothetical protein